MNENTAPRSSPEYVCGDTLQQSLPRYPYPSNSRRDLLFLRVRLAPRVIELCVKAVCVGRTDRPDPHLHEHTIDTCDAGTRTYRPIHAGRADETNNTDRPRLAAALRGR
jgi:hypothetical protein